MTKKTKIEKKDPVKKAFLKSKEGSYFIRDVVDSIKAEGGSPEEASSPKVYLKAKKKQKKY